MLVSKSFSTVFSGSSVLDDGILDEIGFVFKDREYSDVQELVDIIGEDSSEFELFFLGDALVDITTLNPEEDLYERSRTCYTWHIEGTKEEISELRQSFS